MTMVAPYPPGPFFPSSGASPTPIPGVIPGGIVGNAAVINAFVTAGGTYSLPNGNIGIGDAVLNLPAGVTFKGQAAPNRDPGAGTTLVPIPGATATQLLNTSAASVTLESMIIDATQNGYTGVIWEWTGPEWKLKNFYTKSNGTGPTADMHFDTGANRGVIEGDCQFQQVGAPTQPLTLWDSNDNIVNGLRHVGMVKIGTGNHEWTGGHITGISTQSPVNLAGTGVPHYTGVVIDSSTAAAGGLILHSGASQVTFDGCRYWQGNAVTTVPIVHETNGAGTNGVRIHGGTVDTLAGVFSNVVDNPNAGTEVVSLAMQNGSVAATGGQPALYGSLTNGIGRSDGNTYNGKLMSGPSQFRFKTGAQAVAIGVSGVDGAPTVLNPQTGQANSPGLGFTVEECNLVQTGTTGGTTVTFTTVATFDDGTTNTGTMTWTDTNGPPTTATAQFKALLAKDNHYVTSLSVTCHVAAASTSLTLTANFFGLRIQ